MYILEGYPTLRSNEGEQRLAPGMCVGYRAGGGNANHLVNETNADVRYLEIGDRPADDVAVYPDDDIEAKRVEALYAQEW